MSQNQPQELVIFQVALVITGEGQTRRPRMLILSKPSVDGAAPSAIATEWISLVKQASSFPVVHDLTENLGMEVASPALLSAKAPDRPKPETVVHREHPIFNQDPYADKQSGKLPDVGSQPSTSRLTSELPKEGVVLKEESKP